MYMRIAMWAALTAAYGIQLKFVNDLPEYLSRGRSEDPIHRKRVNETGPGTGDFKGEV